MTYSRGHRGDYDRWAANGLPSWSYAHALPYFKKQETWEDGASAHRGGDGPLGTCWSTFEDPLAEAYTEASKAAGLKWNSDLNSGDNEGIGRNQNTIRDGRRCSAAVAYLKPAMRAAQSHRRDRRAGVAHRARRQSRRRRRIPPRRQTHTVRAHREVLLAGGVINSPQVLMLSGIGNPDALRAAGIKPQVALRGVGQNLQDHVTAMISFERKPPAGTMHRRCGSTGSPCALADTYLIGGTSVASDIPGGMASFAKVMPDAGRAGRATAAGRRAAHRASLSQAVPAALPGRLRRPRRDAASGEPRRARARLGRSRHADPHPAELHVDRARMEDAARRHAADARRHAPSRRWSRSSAKELNPVFGSDAALDEHIRNTAITLHHPLGTCKMGRETDEMAVVDPQLRVRGVERLRVIDASVMPDLISGNINAPVMMIAEKAADMIRGKPTLAPLNV